MWQINKYKYKYNLYSRAALIQVYTVYYNSETAYNKFSSKKQMCWHLHGEDPCGLILIYKYSTAQK